MSTVKNPVVPPAAPKRKFKKRYVVLGLFALGMVGLSFIPEPTPEEAKKYAAIEKHNAGIEKRNAEIETANKLEAAKDSIRRNLARAAKSVITDAARNPDSVSFSYDGVNEDATTVCVRYRAQNGFGGMNQEYVAFHNFVPKQSASFWNRNCTKGLYSY